MLPKHIEAIRSKPSKQWTKHEEDEVYWFHFTEIQTPEEYQLHYACTHYCNTFRWYTLLLTLFPSENNLRLFSEKHGHTKCGRRTIKSVLRAVLHKKTAPHTEETLRLIAKYGGTKVRKRAHSQLNWFTWEGNPS